VVRRRCQSLLNSNRISKLRRSIVYTYLLHAQHTHKQARQARMIRELALVRSLNTNDTHTRNWYQKTGTIFRIQFIPYQMKLKAEFLD